MDKPTPKTKEYYDWIELSRWLDTQLEYSYRDVLGKFHHDNYEDIEYRDFWHWMIEQDDSISNGCYINIFEWEAEPGSWQEPILKLLQDVVGDTDIYVWW